MKRVTKRFLIVAFIALITMSLFVFIGCKSLSLSMNEVGKGSSNNVIPLYDSATNTETDSYGYRIIYDINGPDADSSGNYTYFQNLSSAELTTFVTTASNYTLNQENYQFYTGLENADVITLQNFSSLETVESALQYRYVFDGWYLDSSFLTQVTELTIPSFDAYDANDRPCVTVYAKWSKYSHYTVSYTLNGGTNNLSNPLEFYGDEALPLLDPTVPADTGSVYYKFDGWFTTSTFNVDSQVDEVRADMATNNVVTLYASYTSVSYNKITFYLNGNNADNSDVTLTTNAGYTLYTDGNNNKYIKASKDMYASAGNLLYLSDIFASTPTKATLEDGLGNDLTSYTFYRWCSSSLYTSAKTYFSYYAGSDNAYANWTETEVGYSISYVLNSGINNASNPTYCLARSSVTLYAPTRTKVDYTAYTFDGWFSSYDVSGNEYSNQVAVGSWTPSASTTLYAKWSEAIMSYNITYELNGGTNSQQNPSTHSTDITLSAPTKTDATIDGVLYRYQFVGWYTDENFTPGNEISVAKAEDITIYAKWTTNRVYSVEYNLDSGEFSSGKTYPSTYSLSDGTIAIPDPERSSTDARIVYNFKGWYIGSNAANGNFSSDYLITQLDSNITKVVSPITLNSYGLSPSYDPDEDGVIELYAYWEEKPDTFAITYVLGDGVVNSNKNPSYVSTLNNARILYWPTRITYDYTNWGSNYQIGITTYNFLGWYTGSNGTGTRYEIVYYTDGTLTLYPYWGASSTYTFTPDTAIRVNENFIKDNSGGYMLYGVYPQTEVESSSAYTITSGGKYYRYEPVLWRYMGTTLDENNSTKQLYLSECVLAGGTYVGDTDFITITEITGTIYRPLLEDFNDVTDEDIKKVATDYAVAQGVAVDDKMGTSSYWLEDIKYTSDAGLFDETTTQLDADLYSLRYYVSSIGNKGYIVSTTATLGHVAALLMDAIPIN